MASVFNLEIYSTGGCFYKGACEHLVFESVDGSRGVMAGHEPVICALKRGEIRFLADGEWQKVAVTEGFVEIMPDFVRLFADTAVKAEKVEEYIFEPHLKKLYAKCDSNAGYWTFLETIYPVITYTTGEALSKEKNGNERASYLFSFIASPEGLNKGENTDYLSLPDIESLRTGELVSIELSPGHPAIMQKGIDDKLAEDEEMFFGRYGSFQHVGWMHEFKIRDILRHKDQYADLMLALNADEFPMKKEYEAMRRYLYELEKVLVTPGDDLLDLF